MLEEGIVYQARLHWVIFVWPVVFFAIVATLGLTYPSLQQPSLLLGSFIAMWGASTWMLYYFSSLTIKTNQLIIRTGFFVRKTIDMPLNKIESVDIRQSILGTLLGYGSLELIGVGGTRELVNYLSKPLTCRRTIEQLMHV